MPTKGAPSQFSELGIDLIVMRHLNTNNFYFYFLLFFFYFIFLLDNEKAHDTGVT